MFSFGKSSRNALTTVSPPMPESNTPIGFIYWLVRATTDRIFAKSGGEVQLLQVKVA
jgi:hypothetical protein